MVKVNISITEMAALKPFLDAVTAVTGQWESMHSAYGHTEENVELAELLDTLTDAARDLREKR